MSEIKSNFGSLLSFFRNRAGLSQNELGHIIGISPTHISKVERGSRNPFRRETLLKIIEILRLSDKEEKELLESAGYSNKIFKSLVYSSPSLENGTDDFSRDNKNPLIAPIFEVISKTLNDPRIPYREKIELGKQLITFAEWLKDRTIEKYQEDRSDKK